MPDLPGDAAEWVKDGVPTGKPSDKILARMEGVPEEEEPEPPPVEMQRFKRSRR